MNLSSSSSAQSGFISEPPLSPGTAPTARPVASAAPLTPSTPSIEAQVVRMGLMTPDEVATTMREEAETGRSFAELAVENGRIKAEDLARLTEPEAPAPAPPPLAVVPEPEPEVASEPEPIAESEPEPEPEPELEPAARAHAAVFVRLTSGERIAAGSFDGQDAAEARAKELMDALDATGEWPQLEGRYVRPDAVVSIDVELTGN
jgi:hypothetical protein